MSASSVRQNGSGQVRKVLLSCAVIVIAALGTWWMTAQQNPAIVVPNPTMPMPNAFDTFNDAANQFVDSVPIGYAIGTTHTGQGADREYTFAEKEKFVNENAETLRLVREGLGQEYCNPPARSYSVLFPYYAKYRSMARLLRLEADIKASRGDYSGAVEAELDAVEMGSKIPKGSVLIGGLVGIAIEAIGRHRIWNHLSHLTPKAARHAIARLEYIRKTSVPYSMTLKEEKWAWQASLQEVFRSPTGGRDLLLSLNGNAQQTQMPAPVTSAMTGLLYMVYSKRRIMNDYTIYMDRQIERAAKPYASKPAPLPESSNPVVRMLMPVLDQAEIKWVEQDTQNALIEAAIALRAYYAEHGAYPDTLVALTPNYLPTGLIDPFSLDRPLCYRRAGDSYVLYSVGPDGKDDGGRAIDQNSVRSTNKNERYYVKPESVGDVVAGKNIW